MATQLLRCAQGNCNQTDLQAFIEWAQGACAGVGVTFDASASSIIATETSKLSLATSTASKATVTSSDNRIASSGGLSTSDEIGIGIGVPAGLIGILGVWIAWKTYQLNKNKSKT